ncbi:hypothetical protein LXL04_005640 [Taraxacum kok-saghyz]
MFLSIDTNTQTIDLELISAILVSIWCFYSLSLEVLEDPIIHVLCLPLQIFMLWLIAQDHVYSLLPPFLHYRDQQMQVESHQTIPKSAKGYYRIWCIDDTKWGRWLGLYRKYKMAVI